MHCWPEAKYIASPNFNQRPDERDISLLVIHNISLPPGEFGNHFVADFFLNRLDTSLHPYFQNIEGLQVSSHCFIDRKGIVTQFVPFDQRAWHAGFSVFQGRENCNDFSIGIELEGTDEQPYSDSQYKSLTALTKYLMRQYPEITEDRIVGHSDIAPSRKTDPGPYFDWSRLKSSLAKK